MSRGLPQVEVQVLLLDEVVLVFHLGVVGGGDVPEGAVAAVLGLQDPLGLLIVEDEGLTHKCVLHPLGGGGEEALAVEVGELGHPGGHRLADGHGELPVGPVGLGGVVGDIAPEELVGPLPGEDHLHVLGRQPGEKVQGDGGQLALGSSA